MKDTVIVMRYDEEHHNPVGMMLLTVDISKEDDCWVGLVQELGVSTFADSLEELRAELGENILLQLNEVERLGFIEEYLLEHNIRVLELPPKTNQSEKSDSWGLLPAGA